MRIYPESSSHIVKHIKLEMVTDDGEDLIPGLITQQEMRIRVWMVFNCFSSLRFETIYDDVVHAKLIGSRGKQVEIVKNNGFVEEIKIIPNSDN